MNAYELADDVKNISNTIEALEWVQKASPLLRQQADRIAELEKGGEVAGRFYWESVVDGHVMAVPSEGTPHYNKDDFPLYTTPQIKELNDEEIKLIKGVVSDYVCTLKMEIDQQKQAFKGYEHCSNLDGLNDELKDSEQALAILKKASEK
jgi:hypothetical protein